MSFMIAVPEFVTAAASDLANIGSSLSEAKAATAAPTTGILVAAEDEVSAAIAAVFSAHGQAFQELSAQAAAFHAEFVQAVALGGRMYAATEAANAAATSAAGTDPLTTLVDLAQPLGVFSPVRALTGRSLFVNGANGAAGSGNAGAAGGWLIGNGGDGGSGAPGGTGGTGGNGGFLWGSGGAGGAGFAGGGAGGRAILLGNGGHGGDSLSFGGGGSGGSGGFLVGNGGGGGAGGTTSNGGIGGQAGLIGNGGAGGHGGTVTGTGGNGGNALLIGSGGAGGTPGGTGGQRGLLFGNNGANG